MSTRFLETATTAVLYYGIRPPSINPAMLLMLMPDHMNVLIGLGFNVASVSAFSFVMIMTTHPDPGGGH
jgi:hypothetical protein